MRGMIVHDCYVMILKIKDMKPQNHNSDKNTPEINRLFLFFFFSFVRPAPSKRVFCIIKFKHKSFGVSMISEVPFNPQLTLASISKEKIFFNVVL